MADRPILLTITDVRSILDGRKTQVRRPVQSRAKNMQRAGMQVIAHRAPGDSWYGDHVWSMRGRTGVWDDYTNDEFIGLCPLGTKGDRLWVRESWGSCAGGVVYRADDRGSTVRCPDGGRWRSPVQMPRWASRLTLRVVDVKVERLHAISEEDARSEGVYPVNGHPVRGAMFGVGPCYREGFAQAWVDRHGQDSWNANPWVFAVTFEQE